MSGVKKQLDQVAYTLARKLRTSSYKNVDESLESTGDVETYKELCELNLLLKKFLPSHYNRKWLVVADKQGILHASGRCPKVPADQDSFVLMEDGYISLTMSDMAKVKTTCKNCKREYSIQREVSGNTRSSGGVRLFRDIYSAVLALNQTVTTLNLTALQRAHNLVAVSTGQSVVGETEIEYLLENFLQVLTGEELYTPIREAQVLVTLNRTHIQRYNTRFTEREAVGFLNGIHFPDGVSSYVCDTESVYNMAEKYITHANFENFQDENIRAVFRKLREEKPRRNLVEEKELWEMALRL